MYQQQLVRIIGGGIAGLAAAVALRCSATVKILEASSRQDFQNVMAGAAAQLTPNGLRALQQLGGNALLERVLQHSSAIENNFVVLPGGSKPFEKVQAVPPGPPSEFPTVIIRWGLLRHFLTELLPEDCVVFDQKLASFNGETMEFEDGTRLSVRNDQHLVVAADGKASRFRSTPLVSNHRVNIKAVVHKMAPVRDASSSTYSVITPTGTACFFGPAGPDGWTYWAISLPTQDDEASYFKLSPEDLKSKLLTQLEAMTAPERQTFVDLVQETAAETIFLQESDQADLPETFSQGNVVLVGDAAHAMSSSYGQAVSFALEDAVTLAHCIKSNTPLSSCYSQMRRDRCVEMQTKSQERTAKAMRGESTDEITRWIHDWNVVKDSPGNGEKEMKQQDTPVTTVG